MPEQIITPAPKKPDVAKIFLIIAVVVLLIGNGAMAYFFYNKVQALDKIQQQAELKKILEEQLDNKGDQTADQVDLKADEILVEWNDWPVETWAFNNQKILEKMGKDSLGKFFDYFTTYSVGRIKEGSYKDKKLFNVIFDCGAYYDEPCLTEMFRMINNDDEYIILTRESEEDSLPDDYEKIFNRNNQITIANLEPPIEIPIPDSDVKLVKTDKNQYSIITDHSDLIKLFKYNDEDYVYRDGYSGCFIVRANDWTIREYVFDSGFLVDNKIMPGAPKVLDINWSAGGKNTAEYTSGGGGCYASYCYDYADYIKDVSQLEKVGTLANGEAVYELKDKNLKADASYDKSILQSTYDNYFPGYDPKNNQPKEKIPFEEFLSSRPLIYWQDYLGGFILFQKAEYAPMAECGKPVIYLYPEKTMDVAVNVAPTGGFSITEPFYGEGWKVQAKPNGELYNYSDNKNYPYLFWEGFGLNYDRPDQGFVVAKADVKSFLEEKLAQLGLIEKEYNEFIDFWLPKMQTANYYFITFVPQADFDQLAPLTVKPAPDTVIRVFMDYQGLANPISVEPQTIVTPERKGFTVVEWGGALHR